MLETKRAALLKALVRGCSVVSGVHSMKSYNSQSGTK